MAHLAGWQPAEKLCSTASLARWQQPSEKIDRMAPRMMAAAGGEARPNVIFGTVAASSGEARLCGMFGTTVIAAHHF